MIRLFTCLFVSIFLSAAAEASRERYLEFSEFRLEAQTGDDFGHVVVSGSRAGDGALDELNVQFLGLKIDVPNSILSEIPRHANGIRLSAEHGYRELGGRTIYVVFSRADAISPPTCDDQWVIAVSELNGAELFDPELCHLRVAGNR